MSKSRIAAIVLGLAALLAALIAAAKGELRKPNMVRIDVSYTADFEKPDVLAREVDNLFVGVVREVKGTHHIGGSSVPSTLYEVEVLESWKGDAKGTILVNQDSGYDRTDNTVYLTSGDQLLEEGNLYLFATNSEEGKWQTAIPVFGDVRISDEQHRSRLRERFRVALPSSSESPLQ